ncbi:MAG: hypothetical protein GY899_09545 [Verrucomicrobiaceae bacterium]|nr:hypothetical protein [Verrucomicrobiaceae bacterium]
MINLFRHSATFSLAALILFNNGCVGYRFGSIKPAKLSHIKSIAIPPFKNKTLKQRSQVLVANEVIKKIQQDGSYAVADLDSADAVLHGVIKNVSKRQLRSSRTDTLRTREIQIIVEITYTLKESGTGTILHEGRVVGRAGAYLDPNFQLTERQALQIAARNAATSLALRLSEGY